MDPLASPTTLKNSNTASSGSVQSEYTRFRACDECRRRKIKCDGRVSGCRHCQNAAVQCVYNSPVKTGRRRTVSSQKTGADPETTLEERLQRIERAVKEHLASRLSATTQDAKDRGSEEGDPPGSFAGPLSPKAIQPKQRALYLWKVSNRDCPSTKGVDGGLLEDFQGKLRFIGESSVFALFLPRGRQWICEKTGDPHFGDPLGQAAVLGWSQSPPQGVLVNDSADHKLPTGSFRGEDVPLPPRHVVRKLVNDYFDRVNSAMPIFNRARFDAEMSMYYQNGLRASPAWTLAFYVILALGCISGPVEETASARVANDAQALAFFRRVFRDVSKVLFFSRDVSGVQALLVTVLFLWETKFADGYFTLLGVIACIGNEIGLHRCGTQLGLDPTEVELRRNVFWVAYILEKDISLRIGHPSSILDNDVTVKLPSGDIEGCNPRLFRHRAKLSRVMSKVSSLLCSQVSTTLPGNALMGTIQMLDKELEEWKKGCELMHNDEETLINVDPAAAQHNLRLRLVYFNCLGAIKRPLSPVFDLIDEGGSEPRCFSKDFESSLSSARASIHLMDYYEHRNLKTPRATGIDFVGASITLFTNTLENPLSESSQEDLQYLKRTSEYLRALVEKGCHNITEMFFLTFTLYSMAAQTVSRLRSENHVPVLDEGSKQGDTSEADYRNSSLTGQ